MPEFKITAKVIGLNPDFDQISGEHYTQVNLAIETTAKPPPQQPMTPFPVQRVTGWKYVLNVFIPVNKWNNQYKMWQQYDLIIKDTGELELRLPKEEV